MRVPDNGLVGGILSIGDFKLSVRGRFAIKNLNFRIYALDFDLLACLGIATLTGLAVNIARGTEADRSQLPINYDSSGE